MQRPDGYLPLNVLKNVTQCITGGTLDAARRTSHIVIRKAQVDGCIRTACCAQAACRVAVKHFRRSFMARWSAAIGDSQFTQWLNSLGEGE